MVVSAFDGLLGRTATYVATSPLGESAFEYFARAVGDEAAIYVSAEAAQEAGYDTIQAPPTLICETVQYSNRDPDLNGYIGHAWDIEPEGWRRVRGGNAYRFHKPPHPTDVIHVTFEVEDVRETTASSGAPMVIVASLQTILNQHGDLLAENRETMIFKPKL